MNFQDTDDVAPLGFTTSRPRSGKRSRRRIFRVRRKSSARSRLPQLDTVTEEVLPEELRQDPLCQPLSLALPLTLFTNPNKENINPIIEDRDEVLATDATGHMLPVIKAK
jgi:hypothetical protein